MPFRDYTNFDDAMLTAMRTAYDAALAKLGITVSDPRTSNLAATIAALASEGQRDPEILCERAIASLAR